MTLTLEQLIQMDSYDREDALHDYMVGKVKQSDVESIAEAISSLKMNRASKVATRIAEVFDSMSATEFSEWWLADKAYG